MDYLPAAFRGVSARGESLENQCENSVRFISRAFEMPFAENPGGIGGGLVAIRRRKKMNFQVRKRKFAHPFLVRIGGLVFLERGFPAAPNISRARKEEIRRIPIPLHECVDVSSIPGGDLFHEDFPNLGFELFWRLGAWGGGYCDRRKQKGDPPDNVMTNDVFHFNLQTVWKLKRIMN